MLAVVLLALTIAIAPVRAQSATVEQIVVQGLFRMTEPAFRHALAIKEGDPYDEARIRVRFKDLWRLGVFEDLSIEVETRPSGGKVLIIKVKERPQLTQVTYEDNKVATQTQIEDRLRERNIELKLGKPIDMGQIFFAESAIRDLLGEGGFLQAQVKAEIRPVTETTRAAHFRIVPGGKTRIRAIDFQGNELFSDRKLRGQLQLTQSRRWYWPWSQKNIYHPLKWDQDVANVRDLYRNEGYLDVEVRPPAVNVRSKDEKKDQRRAQEAVQAAPPPPEVDPVQVVTDEPAPEVPTEQVSPEKLQKQAEKERKKAQKQAAKSKSWVELEVAVKEGRRYTLGDVEISGNEKFDSDLLRKLVPIQKEQVLRNNFLDQGVKNITRLYENTGHAYATVVRQINRRETEDVADVTILVDEDVPYHVSRIEFSGNSATQDRVIRREMLIGEGDLFNRERIDVSALKINQLGFVRAADPVIEPIEEEQQVAITVPIEEQGRNEIQVGGGYSGFDGAFFNGVYSTRNFLGRGQVVSAAVQVGGRSNRFRLSFQEPWFLSRPLLFGASIFRQDVDYGSSLRSESSGFGIILGRRLGRFAQINVGYNWENVSSTTFLAPSLNQPTSVTNENTISSITPVYTFSTVNNPMRPTRGRSINLSMQIAGGPLGGDTSYLKPVLRFIGYKQVWGRRYFALHAQAGYVREWSTGSDPNNNNINGIPRYQRYWLGGDTLGPRVFETRTITPLRYVEVIDGDITRVLGDPRYIAAADLVLAGSQPTLIEVGGDRMFLLQGELVWPINQQAEVAAFLDLGDALFEDQHFDFSTTRASAGIEVRFHLPVFPVPLRLIWGVPVRELSFDRTNSFTFSIGRSF